MQEAMVMNGNGSRAKCSFGCCFFSAISNSNINKKNN